ncbi:MAG: radical SAM protein [Thermoplasmata archaeon]
MGLSYNRVKGPEGVKVKEVHCSTALSRSKLESDFALNPYSGCTHDCKYCYSPFVLRESRKWGNFVDVKRNIPKVLSEELKKKKGTVRIGSVTDPYQPLEEGYRITRMCLKQLARKKAPTIVQTKSILVTRDIDLFSRMNVDVGLTITSLDDDFCRRFEPGAPSGKKRLQAVGKLVDAGVSTWVFIGPLMPLLNDDRDRVAELVDSIRSIGVREIYLDKLNMREGIWDILKSMLDIDTMKEYRKIYRTDQGYFAEKKRELQGLGKMVF